jgi:hypothetical protein
MIGEDDVAGRHDRYSTLEWTTLRVCCRRSGVPPRVGLDQRRGVGAPGSVVLRRTGGLRLRLSRRRHGGRRRDARKDRATASRTFAFWIGKAGRVLHAQLCGAIRDDPHSTFRRLASVLSRVRLSPHRANELLIELT